MGIHGVSNLFENNEPEPSQEILDLGDKLFEVLPSLSRGERYELQKMSDGRTAVVILKD